MSWTAQASKAARFIFYMYKKTEAMQYLVQDKLTIIVDRCKTDTSKRKHVLNKESNKINPGRNLSWARRRLCWCIIGFKKLCSVS